MPDGADTPDAIPAGFCAIVGLPNVGKSTLLNCLLGRRLAAVSAKPQTTRTRLLGVHDAELAPTDGGPRRAQIAFVDTPGIQQGNSPLRAYMRQEALAVAGETDMALLVVDATDRRGRLPSALTDPDAAALAEAVGRRPLVVALNKVDRVAKPELLPALEAWDRWAAAERRDLEVVPIAALTGDGVERLVAAIARRLPVGPPLFPPGTVTDRDDRFIAGELVREQLYHQLGKELPYAAAVVVEAFERQRGADGQPRAVHVQAIIVVERDSQKGIVLGRGGARIKELGIAAREALAEAFGCPAHLGLHVKVMPEWSRGERGLRQLGLQARSES
jgi:GTP-binding protein Era